MRLLPVSSSFMESHHRGGTKFPHITSNNEKLQRKLCEFNKEAKFGIF